MNRENSFAVAYFSSGRIPTCTSSRVMAETDKRPVLPSPLNRRTTLR